MDSWESVTPKPQAAFGRFIDEDERAAIAGTPLSLVAIRADFEHEYAGKPSPRWLVDAVHLETGELICPTFGANATRDTIFRAAAAVLDSGRVIGPVVMLQTGKAKPGQSPYWIIRSATAEELGDFADPTRVEAVRKASIEAAAGSADEGAIDVAIEYRDPQELSF